MAIIAPDSPRAVAFIDGQNLFHSAKESFGYSYPNYDVQCLAQAICKAQGWDLKGVVSEQEAFCVILQKVAEVSEVDVFRLPLQSEKIRAESGRDFLVQR